MGVAASWIARLLNRFRWIGYVGLAMVFYVALHMMWQGHRTLAIDLDQAGAYNAASPIDITANEISERRKERR